MSNKISENTNQIVEKEGNLQITKETVQFKDSVYQLKNVTGFTLGKVKRQRINVLWIIGLFLFSFASQINSNDLIKLLGSLAGLVGFAAIAYNFYIRFLAPPLYGLSLQLNSGSERIFVSEDTNYLRRAIRTLKDFMENPEKFNYINIEVGQDMRGNITIGDVNGNIEHKS